MKRPAKIQGLLDAEAKGVAVPPTLFLSEFELEVGSALSTLQSFQEEHPDSRFIIRSCVDVEDGTQKSMAGHFFSSGPLDPQDVPDQIPVWWQKNRERLTEWGLHGEAHLMVQPYIEASWGGVAFLPWSFHPYLALVEGTSGGAREAVEGRGSRAGCIALREGVPDPLPLPEEMGGTREALREALRALRTQGESLDVEWVAGENGEIVVVQTRPVTRPVFAPLPPTEERMKRIASEMEHVEPGCWDLGGLGESLGHLSPLSASLFEHLFRDTQPDLRRIGICGGDLFFHRVPNGRMYRHAERERRFFRFRPVGGAFRLGLRESELKRKCLAWARSDEDAFDYETLLEVFGLWQAASLYVLHREQGRMTEAPVFHAGEYELSTLLRADPPGKAALKDSWGKVRNRMKRGFLSELRKLKMEIFRNPETVYLDWSTYRQTPDEERSRLAEERMCEQLTPDILISLPPRIGVESRSPGDPPGSEKTGLQPVLQPGKGDAAAPALVIADPDRWTEPLKPGHILIAPYFRNDWIPDLPKLAGVVLEQGGALSHSAIVARELEVPYRIGVDGAVEQFQTGQLLHFVCHTLVTLV